MKVLILNSGVGNRMGTVVLEHPKCMTKISETETILSRQLRIIADLGMDEVILTTGPFETILMDYCQSLALPLRITFVKNPKFLETNYIYSIYCAREFLNDTIVLMHGDLVFEYQVLKQVLSYTGSCMTVSSIKELSQKDFKAVIQNGKIEQIGVEFFHHAVAAQPLYKIEKNDWKVWLREIEKFCEKDQVNCYAESAFNEVAKKCNLMPLDIGTMFCSEIDTPKDLAIVSEQLKLLEKCFL